jgi:hypothetical protein
MASGLVRRAIGRTHGCTDQPANVKKSLANSEPSTHGTKRTSRDLGYLSAFGAKGHRPAIAYQSRFMSTRPSKRIENQRAAVSLLRRVL